MSANGLKCVCCGKVFPYGERYSCDACGGILDVTYADIFESTEPLSQSFERMPVSRDEVKGIGMAPTPMLRAERIGKMLGLEKLYLKCELANLTGSFKDRPVSIGVAAAKKMGYSQVVTASSGNAAAATAACAARQGLECVVIIPATTPDEKVKQTVFYGARVFKVPGPYSNSYQVAKELAEKHRICNVTTTFFNPFSLEGDKIVGYEIYETLRKMPQWVYVPVGAGPLLAGIHKGLLEYKERDGLGDTARMVAVQAEGNSPIAQAFERGDDTVMNNPQPKTIAGGIADGLVGYERDGSYTLRLCRESGGKAMSVSDDCIREAQRLLAELEGVFVEPSAAASAAAVIRDAQEGRLKEDDTVVILLTGHGLKDMKNVAAGGEIPVIESATDVADMLH